MKNILYGMTPPSMFVDPEDFMTEESWEEGWKEEDWEIDEITECTKCASKLKIKQFDVDF